MSTNHPPETAQPPTGPFHLCPTNHPPWCWGPGHGNPGFRLMRYSHPTKRSGKRVAEATGKALGDALGWK